MFKNSSWGLMSHISQTILVSFFFIIIARIYSTTEFANYIIAITIYQLVAAFSTFGLSQWFIREFAGTSNRTDLISKFLKMQIYFGVFFYVINIIFTLFVYNDGFIRLLAAICGLNIIFDNSINAIKCLNIAEFQQTRTFKILTVEAFLKLITGCFLFAYPFSIITLSTLLIIIRLVTLNMFLTYGSSSLISLHSLLKYKLSFIDIRHLIILNWPFVIIGSVSMVNWRLANIIISKTLTIADIANYEISYKVFSIAQLLPVVVSTTVYPLLVKLYAEGDMDRFRSLYKMTHLYYLLFGLFSYTFIYTFSDFLIPLAFGSRYVFSAVYTKQLFLTMLVFPTAFLQANILIAMRYEKNDMWLNIILLLANIIICLIGLHYIKSLAVVTISIFLSFLIFHILQDIFMIKVNVSTIRHAFTFYAISLVAVISYILLSKAFGSYFAFFTFWLLTYYFLIRSNKLKHHNENITFLTIKDG